MRFIANCLLKDGGVLYAVVNASSESSAKQMIVNKSQALPKRYVLTKLNTIKVDKWPTSTKTQIKNGGSHIFEFYFVGTQGMLGNGKLRSLGVKSTATNLFANPRIKGKLTSSAILYLFDETDFKERRKQAKHSAMAQAKETVQSKVRIVSAFNDAIAKCETLQNFELVTKMNLMLGMVLDKLSGDYKEVPLNTIIGATACILYFVSPIDLIPDCIPVIGHVDDAAVVKFALDACEPDLRRYAEWRENQGRVAIQGNENQVKMKLPEGNRKQDNKDKPETPKAIFKHNSESKKDGLYARQIKTHLTRENPYLFDFGEGYEGARQQGMGENMGIFGIGDQVKGTVNKVKDDINWIKDRKDNN